jgi:arabinogalactan endo-1,4-beta-galactosidase
LHYSDTWADPGKQFKPARWKDLPFDSLVQQVHDYTADVLKTLATNGALPDMVQVGNEITGGMLWPDGKVLNASPESEAQQWQRFAALLNAGAKAVREAQSPNHPIRIVLHIHGGGKAGLPKWFFEKLDRNPVDYDVIALSFYPAWDDSMDALKQNISDVITLSGKNVLIAETSYPWKQLPDIKDKPMRWPQTPEGQKQFLHDLKAVLADAPQHKAIGFVWWYPEAVPAGSLNIWRNGFEALFDETGKPLPALGIFQFEK